jgi:superfamily II DNA or RNA helicase
VDEYREFIRSKHEVLEDAGFEPYQIEADLAPFQKHCTRWAIKRGRAALFLNTGLGKTRCQIEWSRQVALHTGKPVIILAPLAVSQQTVREGAKIGIAVKYCKDDSEVGDAAIVITNYERLAKFDHSLWAGVVLDESGILKSFSGSTKTALVETFKATPYRLCCTATPAPNDHLELGNHSEFLGILPSHQMLARWFINDTSQFGSYRLKGHARAPFWDWVSSWAAMASLPSDLGDFSDDGYVLPPLNNHVHVVEVDMDADAGSGTLFRIVEMSATSLHKEKRRTAKNRAAKVADIIGKESGEQWLIWCETDYEADAITSALPEVVDVRGSSSLESKEASLLGFVDGTVRHMVTKPKLAGFGMNFQNCARVAFVGATYSFEGFYQSIRRVWRFGQKRAVEVHVVMAATERPIWDVLNEKREDFDEMLGQMFKAAKRARQTKAAAGTYNPTKTAKIPSWLRSAT